jgi:hypothetical protein
MTEFHAVTLRGPRKAYGSGVVIARPDIDAAALDLFATQRPHDGTGLPERFGPGERGRWGFSPLSGPRRLRLFLVLALPGWPGRTS